MKLWTRWGLGRGTRGQIVIPALFLFPTLMLFIFLIYETAKISREKIRRQFAVDAAAFVEMTNYSDFLNRSAYVNGAFPMRIFREGFHDTQLDCLGRDPPAGRPCKRQLDDMLYDDGVFPRSLSDPQRVEYTTEPKWDIGYGGLRTGLNTENPQIDNPLILVSMDTAKYWNINWDDANQIYKLYVQIYQLLGSVESAQFSVLKRLAANHNFLKKSYWLNTGGDLALAEAEGAVASFRRSSGDFPSRVVFHCAQTVLFHGNQLVSSWGQPYQIWSSDPPPTMPNTISECSGLFQIVTVDKSVIRSMGSRTSGEYPGWPVEVKWTVSSNYFNEDMNVRMNQADNGPRVHATVSVAGFGSVPAVWPDPTPKFQVRTYP